MTLSLKLPWITTNKLPPLFCLLTLASQDEEAGWGLDLAISWYEASVSNGQKACFDKTQPNPEIRTQPNPEIRRPWEGPEHLAECVVIHSPLHRHMSSSARESSPPACHSGHTSGVFCLSTGAPAGTQISPDSMASQFKTSSASSMGKQAWTRSGVWFATSLACSGRKWRSWPRSEPLFWLSLCPL